MAQENIQTNFVEIPYPRQHRWRHPLRVPSGPAEKDRRHLPGMDEGLYHLWQDRRIEYCSPVKL